MDGVYNRKYFVKKATQARDKLRQMGGVQPMPPQLGGIMASSPELMQAAAMRRPVVLPATQAPVAPTPAPQPQPQMLPPSSPLPNVAGIPQTQAPAPRPMAQKPGVKRLANGGDTFLDHYKTPALKKAMENSTGTSFDKAFEFGQKAITTEDPTKLGLPEGVNMSGPVKALEDPERAAKEIVADVVPEKERTGDIKTDLRKAATMTGIERVPAEAEIDELNKAIFGAKLAGAIAGDYVNPATGQAVRPSLGKRMSQAAVEGLAVARDTEERRAKQEAALAAAKMRSAGKSTSGKIPPNLKVLVDIFKKRAETEDIATVAANFNEQYGDNTGTMIMEYIRTGALTPPQPQNTGGGADSPPEPTTYPPGSIINQGGNRFRVDDNGVPQLIQGE